MMTSGLPAGLVFRLLHVGVAVPKLGPAADTLRTIFGYRSIAGPYDEPLQKVTVEFLTQAEDDAAQLELIAPLGDDSPITSILGRNTGGAYHLCFETNALDLALDHARAHGCIIVSSPTPSVAFRGRRIAWFYTQTRQLFELVEQEVRADGQQEHYKPPVERSL